MKNDYIYDKIRGAIYGVAVGDALGGPVEFMRAEGIKIKHGKVTEMLGGGWLDLTPGEVTDDTQMTMAVAMGVMQSPENPVPAIGENFIAWYESGPKDIGSTCAIAISNANRTEASTLTEWLKVGWDTNYTMNGRTGGNGALMRAIYPAVYYASPAERMRMTKDIAMMTHYAAESTQICVEYADAVHKAIFGGHPEFSIKNSAYYKPNAEPTGYVVDTWSNVIEAVTGTETFEDAVVDAVNRGGDADTIGAIAGGLAGAYYGYRNIPKRWIDALDPALKNDMDKLAEAAYKANKEYYRQKFNR